MSRTGQVATPERRRRWPGYRRSKGACPEAVPVGASSPLPIRMAGCKHPTQSRQRPRSATATDVVSAAQRKPCQRVTCAVKQMRAWRRRVHTETSAPPRCRQTCHERVTARPRDRREADPIGPQDRCPPPCEGQRLEIVSGRRRCPFGIRPLTSSVKMPIVSTGRRVYRTLQRGAHHER